MRLLLVEDKDSFRRLLIQALADSPWAVTAVGDPQEALETLRGARFQVMVTDLRLPGMSGLELLRRAKRLQPELRAVLMSAFGEAPDIVEAMRCGAEDFLPKPFDLDRFQLVLERLRAQVDAPPPDPRQPWVAASPAMRSLEEGLARAAESEAPVLFCGEPGTGRSRAARRLHTLCLPGAPFLSLPAESLGPEGPDPDRLVLLKGGSLLLLDLDLLPESSVSGLLKAQESETGRAIRWMATARGSAAELPPRLRDRLGVLSFALPPLRERREDLLPLFRLFLDEAARGQGRAVPLVERHVERELLKRDWLGNARELAWCAALAVRGTEGAVLGALPSAHAADAALALPWPAPGPLDRMLEEAGRNLEAALLRRALEARAGQAALAAADLGLSPRALAQRLREHRIPLEEPR